MGLDMWIRCKTTKRNYEGATGACSGMFGCAPDDEGMIEIGYWRKAYDQQELICNTIKSYDSADDNCVNMRVTKEECESILSNAKEILATHEFNEDGEDITDDEYGGFYATWCSKQKWEDTIEYFTKALEILNEDPDAEIYYCQWY